MTHRPAAEANAGDRVLVQQGTIWHPATVREVVGLDGMAPAFAALAGVDPPTRSRMSTGPERLAELRSTWRSFVTRDADTGEFRSLTDAELVEKDRAGAELRWIVYETDDGHGGLASSFRDLDEG